MSINIYTVKHPLVLHWNSYLNNPSINDNEKYEVSNRINMALIYEASRKSLKTEKLYIKCINNIEEVSLISKRNFYLFCSDLHISQGISKEAKYLIPNINIYNFLLYFKNKQWDILKSHSILPKVLKNSDIIILEKQLDTAKLIPVLEYALQHEDSNTTLQICCTKCKQIELEVLSNIYPKLSIYTCFIENTNN
uniref:Uracil phosphoribosyltransferase n=1 Tax=Helminthocladia australis TaxID=260093 RepID=A0A1G4NTQ4_9FLOR|nr:Uracil phosphoribosyltransferase [Helminthocladia australis]SCW22062.1 Uracil phosphoribosyltransferase [Helminthocladia australis]